MATRNQNNRRSAPAPQVVEEAAGDNMPQTEGNTLSVGGAEIDNVVGLELRKPIGGDTRDPIAKSQKSVNPVLETRRLSTDVKEGDKERLEAKYQSVTFFRQRLAEAKDLMAEGEGKANEASAIIAAVARPMLHARTGYGQPGGKAVMSKDELSSLLCDIFGAKKKGDGKTIVPATDPNASKTPAPVGEGLRKRIVRAYEASEHLAGRDGGSFFEGLTSDASNGSEDSPWTLEDVNSAVIAGDITVWRAYDLYAEIKRFNRDDAPSAAFDPKKIMALVEALSDAEAIGKYRSDKALILAYAALTDIVTELDTVIVEAPAIAAE